MKSFTVVLLPLFYSFLQGETVDILESPVTQRVVAGGTVTFQCRGTGEMGWFVNDQYVYSIYRQSLENDGFDFDTYHETNYSRLTMTAPADLSRNGTKIQCEAYSTSQTVLSEIVWLWIIGPPLTPNVSVELTSWNTMRLSWTTPFTADGYPIIKYVIFTTNSSTGQRSRTDVYPTDGNESLSIVDTPSDCHSLQFEIIAQNSAGNSSFHTISAGFPIAVEEFQVNVSLSLSYPDQTPLATITFTLPEVCSSDSGVLATYILELKTVSGVLVHRTESQYHESSTIEETLTVDRYTCYYTNVSVSIPSFPELGDYTDQTEFSFDDCNLETSTKVHHTASVITESKKATPQKSVVFIDVPKVGGNSVADNKGIEDTAVGLSVAVAVLLPLVLTGVISVVAVFVLRRRRIKAERRSINRPLPSMTDNPIYASSPIYDVIPDNDSCNLKKISEIDDLSFNEDKTRYATSQSCIDQRLEENDSGTWDMEKVHLMKEEKEKSQENRDTEDDCYILMMQPSSVEGK